MTTRSIALGVYRTTGAREHYILFETPVGVRVLVKSIVISNMTAAARVAACYLRDFESQVDVYVVWQSIDANGVLELQPWIVMHQDDALVVYADGPDVAFWISGAELPVP